MSNPSDLARPDTEEVVEIVEDETGHDWTLHKNDPDRIVLNSTVYQFKVVWDGSGWRLEIHDPTYSGENPRWALGNIKSASEVYDAIPSFIPVEIRT